MQEAVYSHISQYTKSIDRLGMLEYGLTLGTWVGLFWAPWWTMPLHALVTTRLFIVGVHDAGHMSLFQSSTWNDRVLRVTGPLLCISGAGWWRPGHNYHHQHSNDLDHEQGSQTAPLTVAQFRDMAEWKQGLYRHFVRPIALLTQAAPLAMTVGQLIRISTYTEALAQLAVFAWLHMFQLWARYITVLSLTASFGVFLFHTQHTFPECIRMKGKGSFENGFYGSSYLILPEWLKIFTAGIEYHHIHHLNSRVPSYRLRECHEEAPLGMWKGIRTITLTEGWESLQLVLWSETKKKLVTFQEVDQEILLE